MLHELAIGGVLVGLTATVDGVAKRTLLPASVLLVIVGTLLSFVPAVPQVAIDPDWSCCCFCRRYFTLRGSA